MTKLNDDKNLLFSYQVLSAKLDIRHFFLKHVVREVYENIGQVLSVVRMQLAVLHINSDEVAPDDIPSPETLVSQSIKDLRAMCKSFYPDAEIVKEEGFLKALNSMMKILYPQDKISVQIRGVRKEIHPELILIIFKMLEDLLTCIKKIQAQPSALLICYATEKVKLIVNHSGKEISLDEKISANVADVHLTLRQRAVLINGSISTATSKKGTNRITLISPYKTSHI